MFSRPWFCSFGIALCSVSLGFGCNGSSQPGVAGGTDGGADRPSGVGAFDATQGVKPDTSSVLGTMDAKPPVEAGPDRPPPEISAQAKRIVPGRARLLGGGLSSCSNQVPASGNGDRWCVYSQPGDSLGATELWVINLTKAVAGTVKCDNTDPNCRRLSTTLWTGQPGGGPAYPLSDRFDGDTLIFHADALSAQTDLYRGPVYAWRPGWQKPRKITGQNGILCTGHGRAEVAWCIDNISPDTVMPTQFDITAGPLSDSDMTVLPKIARITPTRSNDARQWRATFNRSGDYFAYSTGGAVIAEKEALYVLKTADAGKPDMYTKIGDDISRWLISNNSQRIYYYKKYNYDVDGSPAGNLTVADLPLGNNERTLVGKVGAFLLLNDGTDADLGLGIFQNVVVGKGDLKFMKDITKPDQLVTVATNIAGATLSRDLRFTMFAKDFDDTTGTSDAFIAKNDGSGQCTLTTALTTDSSFGAPFNPGSGLAFWADKVDSDLGLGEGWLASPDNCGGKKKFATNVDFWFTVGDQGLIYTDEGDGDVANLKYATTPGGKEWVTSNIVRVQDQIGRIFALTLPNYDTAVFTIGNGGSDRVGIYAYSAFALGTPADAGARDTAGTDR